MDHPVEEQVGVLDRVAELRAALVATQSELVAMFDWLELFGPPPASEPLYEDFLARARVASTRATTALAITPPSPRPAVDREALGRAAYEGRLAYVRATGAEESCTEWHELVSGGWDWDTELWRRVADAVLARLAGGEGQG